MFFALFPKVEINYIAVYLCHKKNNIWKKSSQGCVSSTTIVIVLTLAIGIPCSVTGLRQCPFLKLSSRQCFHIDALVDQTQTGNRSTNRRPPMK